jgi:CheY-specific phosphatase CheX
MPSSGITACIGYFTQFTDEGVAAAAGLVNMITRTMVIIVAMAGFIIDLSFPIKPDTPQKSLT